MDNLIEKGQEDTFVFSVCALIFILISNIGEILDLHLICQYFHHSFASCIPRFYFPFCRCYMYRYGLYKFKFPDVMAFSAVKSQSDDGPTPSN